MVTRRKFIGALAGTAALSALAGAGLRLARRTQVEVEVDASLIGDAWYVKTDHGFSNTLSTSAELNEKAIADILRQMRDTAYRVQPTKIIVPPRLHKAAEYVFTHRPTVFERLCWWLRDPAYV